MSAALNNGDLSVRVERDPDTGAITLRLADAWGWQWTGTLADEVVDSRRGWSGVAHLGETPEAFRIAGETPMRERAVVATDAAPHTGVTLPDVRTQKNARGVR